jgi:Ca2+-binding RTX toxin-like protein
MVQLVKHDLEYILKQIKIAEQHAAGTPMSELVDNPLLPYGLRTVDGSYNNLVPGREHWGASDQPFVRITDPNWRNDLDGDSITFGAGSPGQIDFVDGNYGQHGTPTDRYGLEGGTLVDADPRIISNLIVDQTSNNPIATMLYERYKAEGKDVSFTPILNEDGTPKLANDGSPLVSYQFNNISPDIGDSAPYSSVFTLFGQFFDHGLDLVAKGGNGTIYMPLSPDDPLYVPGSHSNFMPLTRATIGEGAKNTTTAWVDQNQTYGSHASKQVFMREYEIGPDGKPVATGHLLEGAKGGLATWADVKAHAREFLGIELTDRDVGSIPLVAADQYGNFIPGPNGYAQLVLGLGADNILGTEDDVLVEGNPESPINSWTVVNPENGAVGAIRTSHAFLDDIAHNAVPVVKDGQLKADADDEAGNLVASERGQNTEYDNELLDKHFITGDGRGNENIGLTAIHHVFHGEHNLIVEQTKDVVLQSGDLAFLNEWLLVDLPAGTQIPAQGSAGYEDFVSSLKWDGERLFQAGRFVTEMEYQHLVFEEFARKMQPDVDAFLFEPDPDINPAIFAEFANVVYRFGHSMLNETVDRTYADGQDGSMTLFDAFLNPLAYDNEGALTHEQAAGAVLRGMSAQVGNEIDEFVTNVLRNQLTGIPLDLAAINIARGRDTGMPTLNEARAQFREIAGGDSQLDPYTSWMDFALNLKNPESIINFIAAYGTHALIEAEDTVVGKRAAAMAIVFGTTETFVDPVTKVQKTIVPPSAQDRSDFLNATGVYAADGKLGGLQDVDLWVGGIAEKKMDFGGMLGSTFSAIFELQMENLQDGDRFYYLSRVQGMNLLSELESNSLAKMMLRNTDLGEEGTAVPGDIFSRPDLVLYADLAKQLQMTGQDDPEHDNPVLEAISKMVERRGDDAPTALTASGLPDGVTFDATARSFVGTPTAGGVFEAVVTATYASGETRSHTVKLLVIDPKPMSNHLDVLVDDADYNRLYPDVAAAGIDPDAHYASSGRSEGRKPNEYFDPAWYLLQNPDVAAAGVDPLEHYMASGWKEGRNPSAQFDVHSYLVANPDVAAAGIDPLYHYLAAGRAEGRAAYPAQPDSHVIVVAGQPFSQTLPANLFSDGISEYLRYNGKDHVVLQGSAGNDHLIGGEGDDSLWGMDGDDRLEGGYGVDHVHGGDGDDIITNAGTDIGASDFLHGDAGNDVIHGGSGLTLMFGNSGSDFMVAGPDGKTVMGGTENDYILGGDGMDFLLGESGDDWLEGGGRFDTLAGENSELFFNSTIIGHDILNGSNGDVDYDAESGDDIMFQGVGIQRNNGMAGFDWAIHKGDSVAANSDLGIGIFQNQEEFILRDRFDLVEGLSGWKHNDILTGRSTAQGARDEIVGGAAIPAPDDPFYSWSNALTEQGVRRIDGLRELLSHKTWDASNADAIVMETGDGSDILLGGDGSDTFEGKGGNDVIDGDAWMNVRIRFEKDGVAYTTDGLTTKIYREADYVNGEPVQGAVAQFGGRALTDLTFTREVNPGDLENVREILHADGSNDTDTAIYAGSMSWYEITHVGDKVFVARREDENIDPAVDEGMDVLINIERIQFQDGVYVIRDTGNIGPTGRLEILGMPAIEGQPLKVSAANVRDENNPGGFVTGITYRWQVERNDGTGDYQDIDGVTGDTFTPASEHTGLRIRVIGTYIDAGGVPETVYSSPTEGVVGVNNPPEGPLLISDMTPTEGQVLTSTVAFTDPDGITDAFEEAGITYRWQYLDGATWRDIAGADARTYVPTGGMVGRILRAAVDYADDLGNAHTVYSDPTTSVVGNRIVNAGANVNANVGDAQGGTTAGDDIVIGSGNANTIYGGKGGDSLDGGVGNDRLYGEDGNDTLIGGVGNDTVDAGAGNDTVVYRSGDGMDTIDGGADSDTLRIVEAAAGANDTARVVMANGLITRVGNTTVQATVTNVENMQLDLGAGVDTLDYNGTADTLSVNLLTGVATGFDFVRGVENVIGGTGSDTLLGNNADNALDGAAGNDTLRGGFGNDALSGGIGNDQLYGEQGDDVLNGGDGDDRLDGGVGTDTASYAGAAQGVNVSLATTQPQNTGGAGTDTLIGIENLTGSSQADTLTGNAGDNVLDGGAGADRMVGGAGNDTYVVDTTSDAVIEETAGGNDTVHSSVMGTTGYILADNVENLVIVGNASIGNGNNLDNRLTGNAGNDTLNGGAGTDTVVLEGVLTDYTFGLNGSNVTVSAGGGAGTDRLISIERAEIGGVSYNIVAGTNGADANVSGGNEADLVLGFDSNDTLNGGAGHDILKGGDGNDSLNGGAGNDILDGGASGGSSVSISDDFNNSVLNGGSGWASAWTENGDNNGTNSPSAGQIRIDNNANGTPSNRLVFRDDDTDGGTGTASIQRTINLAGRTSATISYDFSESNFDSGETVRVEFSPNGLAPWQEIQVINSSSGTNSIRDVALSGPFTANAVIRFTVSGTNNDGNWVSIDNLQITATTAAGDTMSGGDGDDTYYVDGTSGANIDQVIEGIGGGTDTVILTASGNYTLGDNVENLVVQGSGTRALTGNAADNQITGGTGSDSINGGTGNDTIKGGAGNDTLNGATGTDVAVFDGPAANYEVGTDNQGRITVRAVVGNGGTDTVIDIERVQFGDGEVLQIVTNGATPTAGPGLILGTSGDDVITGGTGGDVIIGGAGNDTLYGHDVGDGDTPTAGASDDDTFIWRVGDGSDVINGGTEGANGDTLVIIGNTQAETYRIYTYDEAVARIAYAGSDENEIVVTRQVSSGTETIIAEITEIEEIVVNGTNVGGNGQVGSDRFEIFGNFETVTSLRPNTITLIGSDGDDVVDISALQSAHRIVFKSLGGNDTIVGTLRPQDVIELPEGAVASDYDVTTGEDGVTTMTNGTHTVRFVSEGGMPQVGSGDDDDEEEDDDTSAPGNDDDGDEGETPTPGNGEDDEEDDDSCDHDEDNGGETGTPPATQPGTSIGAPIAGTNGTEVLVGTAAGETIMALDGHDNVVAGSGADVVHGGAGNDFLSGEAGRDMMFGGDGDDTMLGGSDADMLYGDAGNDRVFGDDGNDLIDAGMGIDTVYGGAGDDRIMASVNDGNDVYYGDDMTGGTGNDTLDMSAITANISANLGANGGSGSVFSTQSGADTIWGIENIVTGSGNDTITANHAVNVIDGGAGSDVFRFLSAADANGDTILGFQPGDRLDLSAIDANTGAGGKQAFTLANGSSFTGPAQLVISHETRDDGDYTVVSGNTTGPDAAEFKISLKGIHDLKASDFVLS